MKPARAATRRFLPTSPFNAPPASLAMFAVQDQVTDQQNTAAGSTAWRMTPPVIHSASTPGTDRDALRQADQVSTACTADGALRGTAAPRPAPDRAAGRARG